MGCEKDMISDFISNLLAEHMPHTTYTLPSDVPLTLASRRSDSLIVTGIIASIELVCDAIQRCGVLAHSLVVWYYESPSLLLDS